MTSVARGLSGLDAHHDLLRLNRPERVDDDLALHGLQRVDHQSHRTRVQLFERLLSRNVDSGEPAAETRVRMVPKRNLEKGFYFLFLENF
jgi:hypothetical protein